MDQCHLGRDPCVEGFPVTCFLDSRFPPWLESSRVAGKASIIQRSALVFFLLFMHVRDNENNLVDGQRKESYKNKLTSKKSAIIRVYEYITRELSLLRRESSQFWWSAKAVYVVQKK